VYNTIFRVYISTIFITARYSTSPRVSTVTHIWRRCCLVDI